MDSQILVSLITVSGSILIAAITFFLTKRNQLDREWRQQKINYYKELWSALSDSAIDEITNEDTQRRFSSAMNTIVLFAPQYVVTALMNFQYETMISNPNRTLEKHDMLLKELALAIRRDINVSGKDNPDTFSFHLIGSGSHKKQKS